MLLLRSWKRKTAEDEVQIRSSCMGFPGEEYLMIFENNVLSILSNKYFFILVLLQPHLLRKQEDFVDNKE